MNNKMQVRTQRPSSVPGASKTARRRQRRRQAVAAGTPGLSSKGFGFGFDRIKLGPVEIGKGYIGTNSLNSQRGMVGLGNRAIDIQRSMPRLVSTTDESGNMVDRIFGTDLLSTLTSANAGNKPGDILLSQLVSPGAFTFTRLFQFAGLYQRYRFRKIIFVYEPIANATQSGQLILYPDFDVDNIISSNTPTNVSIAAAHQNEQITQIWQPKVVDFSQVVSFTDLFTEVGSTDTDDLRLSVQGVFYAMAASDISSNIPLGNLYVDYEVDFSVPFLNNKIAASAVQSAGLASATMVQSNVSPFNFTFSALTPTDSFGPISLTTDTSGNLSLAGVLESSSGGTWTIGIGGTFATTAAAVFASATFGAVTNVSNESTIIGAVTTNGSLLIFSGFATGLVAGPSPAVSIAGSQAILSGNSTASIVWSYTPPSVVLRASKTTQKITSLEREVASLRLLAKEVDILRSEMRLCKPSTDAPAHHKVVREKAALVPVNSGNLAPRPANPHARVIASCNVDGLSSDDDDEDLYEGRAKWRA